MWLNNSLLHCSGSALALLMMYILKCLHAKLLFWRCFDIDSKLDKYLDVFSVVLSNTVFIRLEHSHKSIVNLQVNSLSVVVIKKNGWEPFCFTCACTGFARMIYCVLCLTILGEETLIWIRWLRLQNYPFPPWNYQWGQHISTTVAWYYTRRDFSEGPNCCNSKSKHHSTHK